MMPNHKVWREGRFTAAADNRIKIAKRNRKFGKARGKIFVKKELVPTGDDTAIYRMQTVAKVRLGTHKVCVFRRTVVRKLRMLTFTVEQNKGV